MQIFIAFITFCILRRIADWLFSTKGKIKSLSYSECTEKFDLELERVFCFSHLRFQINIVSQLIVQRPHVNVIVLSMSSRSGSLRIRLLIEWEKGRGGESLQKLVLTKICPPLVENHVRTLSPHQSAHQDISLQKILRFFSVALMTLFSEALWKDWALVFGWLPFSLEIVSGPTEKADHLVWHFAPTEEVLLKNFCYLTMETSIYFGLFLSIR